MVNFLVPALILFVLASLFKISFIYSVSYVLFAVYVLAAFWSHRNLTDLRVRREFLPRALIGDVIDIHLDVENRGVLPVPWLFLHERLPVALVSPPFFRVVVSLRPRERRRFSYRVQCRQRGWYPVGPLTLSLGDVFGLNAREREFVGIDHVTVYPKILPLDELGFPSQSPFGHIRSMQPLYEDPARVVGIREYQSGDSLRRINWKASASSGVLQVRKLEPAQTLETVILLNVNLTEFERQYAYATAEMGIVVAASIANYLASLRQEIGLLTNGDDPAEPAAAGDRLIGYLPRKGRSHLTSVFELLGRVTLAHDRDFCPLVRAGAQRLPWGATLVVVTARESEELLETVLPLHRSGFNIVLVYLDYPSPASYELAQQRATMLGLRPYRIWREQDLDVWRRQAMQGGTYVHGAV